MFASVRSSCLVGIDAVPVDVEVNLRDGPQRFSVIGLGGAAVRESRERILAALESSGFEPPGQILVNLAPAEVKKESSVFDLPIAVGILVAMGVVAADRLREASFCGELSLTGEVKCLQGAVAHALQAAEAGRSRLFVPTQQSGEAAVSKAVQIVPVQSLTQVLRILQGSEEPGDCLEPPMFELPRLRGLSDVVGQEGAKRALVVAAAGGHNLLMIGPPGCGKSMLASRLPELLPPLSLSEQLEVVRIHSVAGQSTAPLLQGVRPFRSPHHGTSEPGLIGGGTGPRPGEISLAHRGVLFLDEFPEFRRGTLEALRAPLESGMVQLSRARASVYYPARFQLIAAMNPCPCGRLGVAKSSCRCSHYAVRDYLSRLSQPILDRIDLQVELHAVPLDDLVGVPIQDANGPGTIDAERWRLEIADTRALQLSRNGWLNSEAPDIALRKISPLTPNARTLMAEATRRLGVSARGYMRLLRVARTISDMNGDEQVTEMSAAEAVGYRCLERLHTLIHGGSSPKTSVLR